MDKEFETKVVDIDPKEIISKLKKLGAKETPEKLLRRYVFDMESDDIEWIRLRDNGDKVTLTYKHKVKGNVVVGKTIEIEVEVGDFEKTAQILSKVLFKEIYYQENKVHIFTLDDIEFSIATWPHLKPYLEVESHSPEKVIEGLTLLGLQYKDSGDKDIADIYNNQGLDIHTFKELKF
jgi:adenylate cyclase class 2